MERAKSAGAERFGWARRPLAPRQMRDEAGLLVGWGVSTATFPALMFAATARGGSRRRAWRDGDRRDRRGTGRLDGARADRGRWSWLDAWLDLWPEPDTDCVGDSGSVTKRTLARLLNHFAGAAETAIPPLSRHPRYDKIFVRF